MLRVATNVTRWRTATARCGMSTPWFRSITVFEAVQTNCLKDIEIDEIRNFSVIAHVDHGKSTLSDAVLSFTGNISETDRKKGQVLDTLKVER